MPTSERADLKRAGLTAPQCSARSQRTGKQCGAYAIRGGTTCRVHGGAAPQVKEAALRRLAQAADVLVQRLLGFALDGEVADPVALAAIRDALDRAGLNPKTAVEIELKPYEQVLAGIADVAHVSRAESRARRGIPEPEPPELPDPLALPASDENTIVDAEVVPDWADDPAQQPGLVTLEQAAQDTPPPAVVRRVRSRRV